MKKKLFLIIGLCFLIMAGTALAKDYTNEPPVLEPTIDGNDVILPDALIQTVPPEGKDRVLARFHDEAQPWVTMIQEGKNWRVPNAVGKDFHPYTGDPYDYKPTTNHSKLENIWSVNAKFIKKRPMGICLHVE